MYGKVKYRTISIGCDPEFFFSFKGKTRGAEKVIKKDGIVYEPYSANKRDGDYTTTKGVANSKIVIDGVQAELNPRANTCRANLGNEISCCFRELYKTIKENKDLKVDFSQVVEVSKKELKSLSEKSREFGCAPSKNAYLKKENKITVNPNEYLYRSAGGHIHLGHYDNQTLKKAIKMPERVVPMLDLLLGNTCVLIDKDPLAKERRKIYGKAGEHRLPKHGLEYRSLSNFWLNSYELFSFVTGMARFALLVVASDIKEGSIEKRFLEKVDIKDVEKAINENDYDLALKNFNKIEEVLIRVSTDREHYPLTEYTIKEFKHFITKPLSYWFKQDPLEHWIKLPEGHGIGWETWCKDKVKKDMIKEEKDTTSVTLNGTKIEKIGRKGEININ